MLSLEPLHSLFLLVLSQPRVSLHTVSLHTASLDTVYHGVLLLQLQAASALSRPSTLVWWRTHTSQWQYGDFMSFVSKNLKLSDPCS